MNNNIKIKNIVILIAIIALIFTVSCSLKTSITGFAVLDENSTNETITTNQNIETTTPNETTSTSDTTQTKNETSQDKKEKPDKESKQEEKAKPETPAPKEPNKPPVWKSDINEFTVNGKTAIDLNSYFSDENNDTITYTSTTPDKISVEISNSIVTLTPLENNFTTTIEFTASDGEKSTKKEIKLIVPERLITINLNYKSGTIYDIDNDGNEPTTGAIDLTVENSQFSWNVNETNLCTRWETYSIGDGASTTVCYGSEKCCSFVGLGPTRDNWKEYFYSIYGQYGATLNNIANAQIIYVDYGKRDDKPFVEIYYSQWKNLSANYYLASIDFQNVCVDTCSLTGFNETSYKLIFEIDNAVLNLDTLTYSIAEEITKVVINLAVKDNKGIPSGNYQLYKDNTSISTKEPIEPDYYNIEVVPTENIIDKLVIENANMTKPVTAAIGIDNVTREISIENVDVKKRYAVDLEDLEFEKAKLTTTAQANSLFKCRQWDYENEVCFGSWEKVRDLAVGEQYELTLTAKDPGFIEGDSNITLNITPINITNITELALIRDIPNITIAVNNNATIDLSQYFLNIENAIFTYFEQDNIKIIFENNIAIIIPSQDFIGTSYTYITAAKGANSAISNVFSINVVNVTAIANITPNLILKKKDFSLDEDVDIDFEYLTKQELIKEDKWKEEYEIYEEETEKTEDELKTLQQKITKKEKQFKKHVKENETIEAFVLDYSGALKDINVEIEELRQGKFDIKLPKQRSFRAGKYTLKIDLIKDGITYTQEQDFTWGVLAINVNKSIYLPNEDSFIGIGVLDDRGKIVCNADVTLEITNPSNQKTKLTTSNGDIKISPECTKLGVTELPDYYTTYSVNGVGNYVMNLTAVTANGIRSILDNFSVQNNVDFDVARNSATRVYPLVPYIMDISIIANKNYNGIINEYVPAGFEISEVEFIEVEQSNPSETTLAAVEDIDKESIEKIKNNEEENKGFRGHLTLTSLNDIPILAEPGRALAYPEDSNNINNYLNVRNEANFQVVERVRSLTDKALLWLRRGCEFEYGSEISPCPHSYNNNETEKEEIINQAHSLDKTPIWLRRVSHEFFLDSETAESHTVEFNKDNNYKNVSILNNIANFFNLIPSAQAQADAFNIITTINDTKIIIVPVNLKKGSKYILSYKFDAPDTSPEFYLLGPLEIGAFKEARNWQIANDQPTGDKNTTMFFDEFGNLGQWVNDPTNNDWAVESGAACAGRSCAANRACAAAGGSNMSMVDPVDLSDCASGTAFANWTQTQAGADATGDCRGYASSVNNVTWTASTNQCGTSWPAVAGYAIPNNELVSNFFFRIACIGFTATGESLKIDKFNITCTDNRAPRINASLSNLSTDFLQGNTVNLTANVSDAVGLSVCQFIDNQSGPTGIRYFNTSVVGFKSTMCSQNYTIALAAGNVINFTVLVNDTFGNINRSVNRTGVAEVVGQIVEVQAAPDNTFPVVNTTFNVTSPLVNDVINFTGNITDNIELSTANITYNMSGVLTKVNFSGLSGTARQVSNATTLTGCTETCTINFTMFATDTSNNVKQNSTLLVVPDRTPPIVNTSFNITSPLINDVINFTGNITDNNTLLSANITYNMSGVLTKVNFSLSGTSAQVSNATQITTGAGSVINFTMYATDTSNNVKQNSTLITVTALVDTTPPGINITNFNSSQTIRINNRLNISCQSFDSATIGNITFNLTGNADLYNFSFALTGDSSNFSQNITVNVTRGNVINATCWAYDSSSNGAQNSTLITVANTNATQLSLSIVSPTNNLKTTQQPLDLNVTFAADPDDDVVNITYYINGKINQTQFINTTFNASDGVYILNVSLHDNVTSLTYSANVSVNFTIDRTFPVVNTTFNITSPVINNVINFTGNVTDNIELLSANITYNISGVLTKVNFTLSGTSAQVSNATQITGCTETCVINFTMYATDTSNNVKQNSTLITVADVTSPVVNTTFNVTSPLINDVINFTGNVTDGIGLLSANITYNMSGSLTKVNFSLSGTSAQVSNATQITTGAGSVTNFTMYVTDIGNNVKQNSTLITVPDTAVPVVNTTFNITSPLVNSVINFTGNITDNVALLSANITYNFSGSVTKVNFSLSGTTAQISNATLITGCVETCVINFTMFATDTSNNVRQNATLITIADVTSPVVNTTFNVTSPVLNDIINFTGNVTDAGGLLSANITYNMSGSLTKVNFSLSGTTAQVSNATQITTGAGSVTNFTMYVTDTSNNVRQNSTLITVPDTAVPVVNTTFNITSPLVNSVINFTGNITDNVALLSANITYNFSGSVTKVNFSLSGTTAQISNATLITGCVETCAINFTMYATDSSNNVRQNATLITIADVTLPVVNTTFNVTSPVLNDIINFTGNVTDAGGLLSANITYNMSGSLTKVNFSLSGTSAQVSNATQITTGAGSVTNFTMYVTDISNNVKQNSTLITIRDVTFPVVNTTFNITSPVLNDVINFTGNVTDDVQLLTANITYNLSGVLTKVNFSLNGVTAAQVSNATQINVEGGSVINFTMYATDIGNNVKQNSTLITVADRTLPVVNTSFNITSPLINDIINFTGNITDNVALLSANITYNMSGVLTKVNFTLSGAIAQVSNATQITVAGGSVINFTMYATDTSNNVKQNSTLITVRDAVFPVVNTTFNISSSLVNDVINFTGNITDDVQLLSANITYNMSGVLTKINFSLNGVTAAQVSNATLITGCTETCVINFTMYAIDIGNNVKQNSTLITVADVTKPRINASLNISVLYLNQVVNMTANVSDGGIGLSFCRFVINQTGAKEFFNKTVTGNDDKCSQNFTIAVGAGNVINFSVIVNDTSNNLNQSEQIVTVGSEIPVTNCTNLETPNTNYTLIQDANSGGTCFYVLANNITLDCKGFEINYSQSVVGYGVNITSYNYTTIRSCKIEQADLTTDKLESHGVYIFNSVKNISVYNNTINVVGGTSSGVYLSSTVYNNSVYNNSIRVANTFGQADGAVSLFLTAYNNYVYGNDLTANDDVVDLLNTVYNNYVYGNTIRRGAGATGIILQNSVYNNSIYNNTIIDLTLGGEGIYLITSAINNSVYNNIIINTGSGTYGIRLESASYGNLIYGNNITSNNTGSHGIYLNNDVFNNTIYDNNITIKNTTGSYGIYLLDEVSNNTFYRNIISSLAVGIMLNGTDGTDSGAVGKIYSNTFTNDTIVPCTTGCNANYQDIVLTANATDITFTNVSMNKSRIAFVPRDPDVPTEKNNLTIQWYLTVNVTNSTNNIGIANAQVVINDSFAVNIFNGTTDITGGIPTQTVTEFTMNGSVTFNVNTDTCTDLKANINITCFTPYNFSANISGYNSAALSIDVNRSRLVNFSMSITTAAANAPIIKVNNASGFAVDPIDGGAAVILISFNVTDTDGVATINASKAIVNLTLGTPGFSQFRFNVSETSDNAFSNTCYNHTQGSVVIINCTVIMRYYDNASTNKWVVNVSVQDTSGQVGRNDTVTFTYNTLSAITLPYATINFSTVTLGQANVQAYPHLLLNNTGNDDFDMVNISAAALFGMTTTSESIAVTNFYANVTNNTGGLGQQLQTSPVILREYLQPSSDSFENATLIHGHTSSFAPNADKGNKSVFFWVDVPSSGLSSQLYNNTWNVTAVNLP